MRILTCTDDVLGVAAAGALCPSPVPGAPALIPRADGAPKEAAAGALCPSPVPAFTPRVDFLPKAGVDGPKALDMPRDHAVDYSSVEAAVKMRAARGSCSVSQPFSENPLPFSLFWREKKKPSSRWEGRVYFGMVRLM